MNYVSNAFSLQMVARENLTSVGIYPAPAPTAEELTQRTSIVGHADIAAVIGVPMNRASVQLKRGDTLLVAQLMGGRLPEGSKTLPEGFQLDWIMVTV